MFDDFKTITIPVIIITGLIFLAACHSEMTGTKENDTTTALKILLDSAFYKNRLARSAQLNISHPFGDTLIFKYSDVLAHHVPETLLYKLLNEDDMCKLMAIRKTSHLQFLELDEFIKTSDGYRTALGTHCMWKGIIVTEPSQSQVDVCKPNKYCNAVLHMNLTKRGNNLSGSKFSLITY